MVAVVSGSGLGLFNSSASTLNAQGTDGNSVVGRGNDRVFVNTANGNLVVQSVDDVLVATGLDTALVRTYNSQGLLDGDNDDSWRIGFYRRVVLDGPLGDAQSTVTKTFGDGAEIVYRYDAGSGRYLSTDGNGAHDTLSFSGGEWTWTDGATLTTETYGSDGRLSAQRDTSNNVIQYVYTGNLLTQVIDASGQQTILQYDGNNLASVRVVSQGQEQTLTLYSYDAQNRLIEVAVDYSWNDGSVADQNSYLTTYRYVGTTNLLAETTQRSGMAARVLASQTFTYELIGGLYRVKTVTDAEGRTTTFDYTLTSNAGGLVTTFAPADAGDLHTTDTQVADVPYPRIDAALTTPTAGLTGAALLETANGVVIEPKVAFDSNGNGFAVWAQGGDVFARRYTRANDTWAAAITLDTNANTVSAPTLALDAAGNAVVAWAQSNGTAVSAYGLTFNVTTGNWGTAALLETTTQAVATTAYSVSASIAGTQAAVAFLQTDGTRNNAYVARWNGSAWSAATLVEARTDVAAQPSVAVDSQGNAAVLLQQSNGTANSIYVNRFTASTATWSGATLLETSNTAAIEPKVVFDANGNGFAVWSQGADVFARRYTRSTNTWAAAITLDANGNATSTPALAVDAAGNAIAAWAQSNGSALSTYAAVFNPATGNWGAATLLESTNLAVASTAYSISATITSSPAGIRAAVAWLQTDGTRNDAYLARWNGSTWSGAALAEARNDAAAQPSVAIDALGNAVVAVQQSNGTANSLYANRYVGDTTPYRVVAAGNTWRSIANAVYGIDSDAAGQRLSEQLLGQSLTVNNRLTGFPPTLQVPTSSQVTVPAYYIVLGTDDWVSITDTLYGTRDPNAVLALQGATGHPTLFATQHLPVPTTLRYTASGQVTITAGNPLISTTDNVTTSQQYGLLSGAPSNSSSVGWQPSALLENRDFSVVGQYPRIELNANGDGFAIYSEWNRMYARRFDAATQSWGVEMPVHDGTGTINASPLEVAVDAAGNAVAVWQGWSPATSTNVMHVSNFNVASGAWSAAVTIPNAYFAADHGQSLVKMSAAGAAITYIQYHAGVVSLYVTRNLGGGWSAGQLVETGSQGVGSPGMAMDDAGNIMLTWQQSDGTFNQAYSNRWLAASGSLSGVTALTSAASGNQNVSEPQLSGDAQGNLLAVYRAGSTLTVRRFDAITGTWQAAQSLATNVHGHKVASDAAGNAAIMWHQVTGASQALMFSRYDRVTGSWPAPDVITSIQGVGSSGRFMLEIQGKNVVAAWVDSNPMTGHLGITVSRNSDGAWSTPQQVVANLNSQNFSLSMDGAGNISFVDMRTETGGYTSAHVTRYNTPYYTIPSGATWRAIANTLYGLDSVAAGNALRDELGNPPLDAGNRLTNLPARLTVSTTALATVPPYYVVQAGDSWGSIAQAIYGTTSTRIEETLRRVTGDPVLAAGLHLAVPATLYYGSDTIYLQTDVTNSLGAVDTYVRDASGRLTAHRQPTVDGVRIDDRYEYDAAGNLTRSIHDFGGLNRTSDFAYDGNGNLTNTWDSLGNATTRTYDQWNQLLTETSYTGTDPDGAGAVIAVGAMTTHYVYDGLRRLRFVISPDQRVTEHAYNGWGQRVAEIIYPDARYTAGGFTETAVGQWTSTQNLSRIQRTDFSYDFRGNLSNARRYERMESWGAGDLTTASIASFLYDQRGRLTYQYTPVGSAFVGGLYDSRGSSNFGYDVFGKVTGAGTAIDNYQAVDERRFDDVANMASVTENAYYYSAATPPRYSIESYNAVGETVSIRRLAYLSSGSYQDTTHFAYDAAGRLRMTTDTLGVRTYKIYDAMGRNVGAIDAEGRLTRFFYNHASEVVKTVRYSSALGASTLASLVDAQGKPAEVSIDTLVANLPSRDESRDQIARAVFDAAGRLAYVIDALGGVTQTRYDGAGRVIGTTQYANPVSILDSVGEVSVAQLAPGGAYAIEPNAEDDRNTRSFLDADGNVRAVLDAEGYLTEFKHDSAGRLIEQVAYANATPVAERAAGTLDALRPAEDLPAHTDDPESDIRSYFFYDIQGRRVAEVDGKGYLTETVYDRASNVAQVVRYENATTVTTTSTLISLRSAATGVNRTTSFRYDGMRRVVEQTNHEGTVTRVKLDADGNVLATTIAAGTGEARTTQAEVDGLGRMVRELSAQGSAEIAGGMDPTTAWSLYGTRYQYDGADRRIATIDPNGSRTVFFYDKSSRLRFTVRDLGDGTGELVEMRYDALGQLSHSVAYTNRISTATLAGGLVNDTILVRAAAANDPAQISVLAKEYRRTGEVEAVTDAIGARTEFGYNTFRELTSETAGIDAGRTRDHLYDYDRRGLQTFIAWEPLGINQTRTTRYDAFGRAASVTDQYGNVVHREYDALGRVVAAVDALGRRTTSTYDAFSRARTSTDALQNQTIYSYDDAARRMTVTTPEGVEVTTVHNRDGQVFTVSDSAGATTTYHYDANGQLQSVSDDMGAIESRTYDRGGRLETVVDGREVTMRLQYDAANRVLTRTQDFGGLALRTSFEYDGQGRVFRVTEPGNRVTRTNYYADGQVHEVIVDENGLAIRTEYHYDLTKNVVTVTENADGAGPHDQPRRTEYVYDDLGRRTRQIVDPAALNLVTEFRYDRNGRVTRSIDAEHNSTWHVYDAAGQMLQTIDALGGVTDRVYDAAGRVVLTRRHANAVSVAGFQDQDTLAFQIVAPASQDRVTRTVYDGDGRERFSIATLSADVSGGVVVGERGVVTERAFDDHGNVTSRRVYSNDIAIPAAVSGQSIAGLLSPSDEDRVDFTLYDTRDQAVFLVDVYGAVRRQWFDDGGNLIRTTAYATSTDADLTVVDLTEWSDDHAGDTGNRTTHFWYDALGRVRFALDAQGYLKETGYLDAARRQVDIAYARPQPFIGTDSVQYIEQHLLLDAVNDRRTTTFRDAAGRIERVEQVFDYAGDTNSAVVLSEQFTYDGLGNKRTYRNANGDVWTYRYDANGRLTDEISPLHTVTRINDVSGTLTPTSETVSVVTRMTYDLLGNVKTRTEGIRRFTNETENTAGSRTTTYGYDALGRQTSVTHPATMLYSPSLDDAQNVGIDTQLQEGSTPATPVSRVTYNALGDAVMSVDVSGARSRKAYDALGRVKFEVDALGFVTGYGYDVFGNATSMTRYATAIDAQTLPPEGEWSAAQIDQSTAVSNSFDRLIETHYDRLNRRTRVIQPGGLQYTPANQTPNDPAHYSVGWGETAFEYNALGDLVRERKLLDFEAQLFADTYFFYDRNARRVHTVDALGYVMEDQYDARGNLTRHVEYAAKLTGSAPWNPAAVAHTTSDTHPNSANAPNGYDRRTTYEYDSLDRVRKQTVYDVEFATGSGQATGTDFADQVTRYDYDAVGNRTVITDHYGARAFTYYDVLGRVRAIAQPARLADTNGNFQNEASAVTPLIELRRDVYGNVVEQIRYGTSATDVTADDYTAPAGGATQWTRMQLDHYGRLKHSQDASLANRFFSYNIRGDVAKEWQVFHDAEGTPYVHAVIHEYDLLGREIGTIEPLRRNDTETFTPTSAVVTFNPTWYNGGGATPAWLGDTVVDLSWQDLGTDAPVRVIFLYTRRNHFLTQGDTHSQSATISARSGAHLSWRDDGNGNGGVFSVDRILVYTADLSTLLRDSWANSPPGAASNSQVAYLRMQYNGFGEMVAKGTNATAAGTELQEYWKYDNNGRIWMTNADDGLDKTYTYDVAGRMTVEARHLVKGAFAGLTEPVYLPSPGVLLTANQYDALDRIVQQVLPERDVDTGIQVAINDLFLNTLDGKPTLYWTGQPEANVKVTFEYRFANSPAEEPWETLEVTQISATQMGVDLTGLAHPQYVFRIAKSQTLQFAPFARSVGTFHFEAGVTTSAALFRTPPDPASEVSSLLGNYTNGIITWAAPDDLTVTPGIRFQRDGSSVWEEATVTRVGGNFRADATLALRVAGAYAWQVTYARDNLLIAFHSGSLSSDGYYQIRTVDTGSTSPLATEQYSAAPPAPQTFVSGSTRQIFWNVPSMTVEGPFDVRIEYKRASDPDSAFTPGTLTTSAGPTGFTRYAFTVSGFPQDSYEYRVTYRLGASNGVGGRVYATQRNSFSVADAYLNVTNSAIVAPQSQPLPTPPISSITGTAGVGTAGWSNVTSQWIQATEVVGQLQDQFSWVGPNSVRPTWAGGGNSGWVVIDYITSGESFSGTNENVYPSPEPRTWSGTMTRDAANAFQLAESSGGPYWSSQFPVGGVSSIQRLRVYESQYGALIADSNASSTGPGIKWDAPGNEPNITAQVWWEEINGPWRYLGEATRESLFLFTMDVSGIPDGSRHIKVEYYRPNETWAYNTAIKTISKNGVNIPILTNQGGFNHDPTWITNLQGNSSNGTISWSHPAPNPGYVTLEYKSGNQWLEWQRWTSGTDFSFNTASFATTSPVTYEYRVRYYGATNPWPTATTAGTVTVRRIEVPIAATLNVGANPANQTYPATLLDVSDTGHGLQWTFGKDSPQDTITFSYNIDQSPEPEHNFSGEIAGNGPTYSTDFPLLPDGAGQFIYWMIEYKRPGENHSYARLRGFTQVWANTTDHRPNISIYRQMPEFPSGRAEILPPPAYTANNTVSWTSVPEYPGLVRFLVDGQQANVIVAPDGRSVNLANVSPGPHTYELQFWRPETTSYYARAKGTFDLTRTTVYSNYSSQILPRLADGPPRSPYVFNQYDRWGNVIAYQDTTYQGTNYRYNVLGQLTTTTNPYVYVLDTRQPLGFGDPPGGYQATSRTNYYDMVGRAVAARDENGNVNGVTLNAAGQITTEWHADGGSKLFMYDGFGRQTQVIDEIGWRRRMSYDSVDRQTGMQTEWHPEEWLTRAFTYDELGRRITETSGALAQDGTPETMTYYYDLAGRVIRTRSQQDAVTGYDYDLEGHKITETNAIGDRMSWQYDHFGRVNLHFDMSGTRTDYTYNGLGLIDYQSSTGLQGGQAIDYQYDEAGNLRFVIDEATNRRAEYGYDFAGRKSRERTTVDGVLHQDTQIEYDQMNRIARVADLRYRLEYLYDAYGNRTRTTATYLDHDREEVENELWFTYDSMNQVLISQGVRDNETILASGAESLSITYYLTGQRETVSQYGKGLLRFTSGTHPSNEGPWAYRDGWFTESYEMDGAGRIAAIWHTGVSDVSGNINDQVEKRRYDGASRLIRQEQLRVDPNVTLFTYDDDGHLTNQEVHVGAQDDGPLRSRSVYNVDAVGVQRSYHTDTWRANGAPGDEYNYINNYREADGYLLSSQIVDQRIRAANGHIDHLTGSIIRTYDVNNQLVKLHDPHAQTGRQDRYLANNLQGQVMTAIEGDFANTNAVRNAFQQAVSGSDNLHYKQHFFHVNGNYVGSFGQVEVTPPASNVKHFRAGFIHGTIRTGGPMYVAQPGDGFSSNFDVNFTSALDQFTSATPSAVVVQEGDTLRLLATRLFGDQSLWYLLAEENGLTEPDLPLQAGTTLRVPNGVYSLANTANVFKPFNASAIEKSPSLMNMTPRMPEAPCGRMGQVLVAIIAIVVTAIVTYYMPAASGWVGAFFQGVVAGTVGSVASQGVGVLFGIQSDIDWNAVALAAVSAGVGQAVGPAFGKLVNNNPVALDLLSGALGNAATQGTSILLGLQDHFSWRDVAISAAASAAAGATRRWVGGKLDGEASFGKDFGMSLLSGGASASVRALFGGKTDAISLATDAFGTALGNSIVRNLQAAPKSLGASRRPEEAQSAADELQESQAVMDARRMLDAPTEPPPGATTVEIDGAGVGQVRSGGAAASRNSSRGSAAHGGSGGGDAAPKLEWREETRQWVAVYSDGAELAWVKGQWSTDVLGFIQVNGTAMSDWDKQFYDLQIARGVNAATIGNAFNRKNEYIRNVTQTAITEQERIALAQAGRPITRQELTQLRMQQTPFRGGMFTMTDAGAGAELGRGERLYNWYGEKISNVVEAVKNPGDAALGALITLENMPADLVEAVAILGIEGTSAMLPDWLEEMPGFVAAKQELETTIHNKLDFFRLGYENAAQAGGGDIFNVATLVGGGLQLARAGAMKLGSLREGAEVANFSASEALASLKPSSTSGGLLANPTGRDLAAQIDGVTAQSTKIAEAIRSGDLKVSVLGDDLFERALGVDSSTTALMSGRKLYLRRNSDSITSDLVHEGTHGLDYINDFGVSIPKPRFSWEKRAFFQERQFQMMSGAKPDFATFGDMLSHIRTNYANDLVIW